jgi:hypothetical protein
VHDGGNAQPGRLNEGALQLPDPLNTLAGLDGPCSEDAGQVTQSVHDPGWPGDPLAEGVLHRGDLAGDGIEAQPDAAQLSDFLAECHVGEQSVQAIARVGGGILPGGRSVG